LSGAAIEFRNVTKRFDGKTVLDSLSFSVAAGEMFAIIGASGTGKSVTLKHIAGLVEPDSGEIAVSGGKVGYLFQSGALLAWKTVRENVALPLEETTSLSGDEIDRRVDAALAAVGLSGAADLYPAEISGGMQKRAGLARSIVREPETILYDEPTSGLDPVTAASINSLIGEIGRSRRVTSVIVTHDLPGAMRLADRIMLLDKGKAVFCGPPGEFAASDLPQVRRFFAVMDGGEA